jgi:Trk K+ transport system NAD-binding subunit
VANDPDSGAGRDHLVVCGEDALTVRVVEELTLRYGEQVTVILSTMASEFAGRMASLPGVRIVEHAELDHQAFERAGLPAARALAVLRQDDLGNFHAALRAQELNPGLRLVLAIFNTGLGERIRAFFTDCAVLSESAMAAPLFVAAALGEPAPSHVRLSGRTMYVVSREAIDDAHLICGLAESTEGGSPRLLPPGDASSPLVLAVADGAPRDPLSRRRNWLRVASQLLRRLLWHKLGAAFAVLVAVLISGYLLLALAVGYSPVTALYLTLLDAAGAAFSNPGLSAPEKAAQFLLTFDGLAILPLVTAAVVGARLTGSVHGVQRPLADHVIVAGLGNVGTRIAGLLHDLGIDVVCVDKNPEAAGVPMARRLGLKVVFGETHREETLRAAGIDSCRAVVSVTNKDIANLETALNARSLAEEPRLVVRLLDDDLAERVGKTISNSVSRSVSYLAAPAFAAAMLEHQLLRTIAVGRHVLLIAEVPVSSGAELVGRRLEDVQASDLRVIATRRGAGSGVDWSPAPGYQLAPQDKLVVLATRAGLGRVLAGSRAGSAAAN